MPNLTQLAPILAALDLENAPKLFLLDASELKNAHVPPFPPDIPVLILNVDPEYLDDIQRMLAATYPDEHSVRILYGDETIADSTLGLLGKKEHHRQLRAFYLPPLAEGTSLESFQEIVAHLRAPNGCPWDKKQTHQTLRPHLLEESYEALAAMDADNPADMAEEFGDLLLQIVLNAQIASEDGKFAMRDIIKGIHDKIVRRHPHVFGDRQVDGVGEVLKNWEQLKEMADAGMEIGSHSRNHPDLAGKDLDYLVWQALGSKEAIEANIGTHPHILAYPAGSYDQLTIDVFRSAHFWGAVTTRQGVMHSSEGNGPFELTRVRISNTTGVPQLEALLNYDWPEEKTINN